MLSGWAGVLTLHVLSRTLMALVFIPSFVVGALVMNYVSTVTALFRKSSIRLSSRSAFPSVPHPRNFGDRLGLLGQGGLKGR